MDNKDYFNASDSSTEVYRKAVVVLTICLGILGVYTIYTVWTTDVNWGFKINWNCFKSPFFPVLAVIGFFLQFFNWQHMSMESWIGRKGPNDSDYKWEKNYDIMDNMFNGCLMPLLSHLIFIPCLYGALMWYAIMGLVHVLGKLSPLFITALVVVVVFFFYRWANGYYGHKYRVAMLAGLAVVAAALFSGTAYYMTHPNVISDNSNNKPSYIGICHITGNGVNLRQGPGTEYDKLGMTVSEGESYFLLGESGDWVKIDYNGSEAWLSSKFCNIVYDSAEGEGMDDDDLGCWTGDDEEMPVDNSESDGSGVASEEFGEQPSVESETIGTPLEHESPVLAEETTTIQTSQSSAQDDNSIHSSVDQAAQFPGGNAAMMKWLSANIRYPESAQQNNKQGRVVVKFVVEKDGSISQPNVDYGIDKDLDKEAIRVVSSMPKWTPAKSNGVAVRSYYTLPVNFRLQAE